MWEKIQAHRFDRGTSSLTFAARLARENEWTPAFTEGAIEEYRRFLFLCASAGHACTPSKIVDEVWHSHLTFTRNYWHDLCRDVLKMELHHDPSGGEPGEEEKFQDQYGRTIESYGRFFGSAPSTYWPQAEVVPRKGRAPVYLAGLAVLLIAGCSGGAWLLILIVGFIGILLYRALHATSGKPRQGTSDGSGGSCTTFSCGTSSSGDSGSSCGSGGDGGSSCGGGGCGGGGD
ncbi:hypothetical protein EON79_09490 [bacterium]|nr:MAG: hypothetical protein EON79_09490 [bacterium]